MRWLVFGAGAQGRLTLEIVRAVDPEAAVLLVDDAPDLRGRDVKGVRVLSREDAVAHPGLDAARGIVALGDNRARLRVAAELARLGVRFATLAHPSAVVSPSASLAPGAVVFAGAIVQSDATVGEHAIVNTAAVVEHDCVIEAGAAVGPGARMGGRVRVGAGAFLGVGVTLCPRVAVGPGAIVGAGAVVACDLPGDTVSFGVPARPIRPVDPDRDWPRLL
jgi:sugar O-acyltransferase (sialic acid O-acetyltransferase NeuD family)